MKHLLLIVTLLLSFNISANDAHRASDYITLGECIVYADIITLTETSPNAFFIMKMSQYLSKSARAKGWSVESLRDNCGHHLRRYGLKDKASLLIDDSH